MPRDSSDRFFVTLAIPLEQADLVLANQIAAARPLLPFGKNYRRSSRIKDGALELTWTEE